jgi:hypothetical protein
MRLEGEQAPAVLDSSRNGRLPRGRRAAMLAASGHPQPPWPGLPEGRAPAGGLGGLCPKFGE